MTLRSLAVRMLCVVAIAVGGAAPAMADSMASIGPQQLAAAKATFAKAAVDVNGDAKSDEKVMEMLTQFVASDTDHKVQAGKLTHAEAVEEWKQSLMKDPRGAILQAFLTVHGRSPYSDETLSWRPKVAAGNAWYAIIRLAERIKLSKDPYLRRQMIERAHLEVFGRVDTQAERDFWLPRDDDYVDLLSSIHNWMYTAKGAQELKATVVRGLSDYLYVDDDLVAKMLALAKKNKWTYKQVDHYRHERH